MRLNSRPGTDQAREDYSPMVACLCPIKMWQILYSG